VNENHRRSLALRMNASAPTDRALAEVHIHNTSLAAQMIRQNHSILGVDVDDIPPEGWSGEIAIDERIVEACRYRWENTNGPVSNAEFSASQVLPNAILQRDAAWSPSQVRKKTVVSLLEQHLAFIEQHHRENFAAELQSLERMGTKMDENPVLSVLKKQGEQSDK